MRGTTEAAGGDSPSEGSAMREGSRRANGEATTPPQAAAAEASRMAQWAGLLVPPVSLLVAQQVVYMWVPLSCRTGATWVLHIIAVALLVASLAAGWLAWRTWTRVGRVWPGTAGGAVPRARLMAVLGVASSAFFSLIILAQAIPVLVLSPCQ